MHDRRVKCGQTRSREDEPTRVAKVEAKEDEEREQEEEEEEDGSRARV